MTDATTFPSVDELFQKWKQFLDGGALTTARVLAADHPHLVSPLQRLINGYLESRAADVNDTCTAVVRNPRAPDPPPVLPGYTILGPLGEGGMGVVYHVRDALGREWALKMARGGQLDAADRERFLDEAKAMAALVHPNVVRVELYNTAPDGRPYFLMPVYPGNLTSRLAEYQADTGKAMALMAAVADGVAHLHANGYVHRDLKPHNILLDGDGNPKVSDFGLVKCMTRNLPEIPADPASSKSGETRPSGARRSKTRVGSAVGTRAYMSPEQAAGLTHLANPRWDVWALGVILHELLTGQRPLSSSGPERLLDPNHPDNAPARVVKPGLDPRLDRVVRKCLARNEKDRYADASELTDALQGLVRGPRRRRVAGVMTGIMATVVLTVLLVARSMFTPHVAEAGSNPLADSRDRLRAGETVVLIPESGMPKWSRPIRGDRHRAYVDEVSHAFTIDTNEPTFIELFADPGIDSYRFEMEIKQWQAPDMSVQGAYVGRSDFASSYARATALTALTFMEIAPSKRLAPGLAHCRHLLLCETADGRLGSSDRGFGDYRFHGFASPADRPWRQVAADVSPAELIWWFDQEKVGSTELQLDEPYRSRLLTDGGHPPDSDFSYAPRGGIGIIVERGISSFRNVRLIPKPKP